MQFSFLHIADTHLGHLQYGLRERFNDFVQAFQWAVQEAVRHEVDFVLLAGDLFDRPAKVWPHTLRQTIQILTALRQAQIPCLAIEGNHDKNFYADRHLSINKHMTWSEFLADQGMLQLLNFVPGHAHPLRPTTAACPIGHFSEPLPGVQVFGIGYKGAGTKASLSALTQTLQDSAREDRHYSVLMLHTGLEEKIPHNVTGTVTVADLMPLQPYFNYLALGHYHKPFMHEDWICNPGSLEITSVDTLDPDNPGGLKLVEVDTARHPMHRVTHLPSPIRPWLRFPFPVNRAQTPEQLWEQLDAHLHKQVRQVHDPSGQNRAPLVYITLQGRLNFPSHLLDLKRMREQVIALLGALECRIHVMASSHQGRDGDQTDAPALHDIEQAVLLDTIQTYPRYKEKAELWRNATNDLMAEALARAAPEALYTTLSTYDNDAETGSQQTDSHAAT